ncbi:hypothetical protein QTP88_000888 [Uroleucon formosanum]
MMFFDLYEKALRKFPVSSDCIFNVDETGVSTLLDPPNVVAQKGTKQVGQCVSAERGPMITIVMTVSATVLEHIKKTTRCTINDKIILLMDNHESHCSFEVVKYAKDNGIVLVTFPSHTTHRLQPLDVGVLGPFKSKVKISQNDWMTNNPAQTIIPGTPITSQCTLENNIQLISPEDVRLYPKAGSQKNIIEKEIEERQKKKQPNKTLKIKASSNPPKKATTKRALFDLCSSSDESNEYLNLQTSDEKMSGDITFGDFVLVKYSGPKSVKYYVGK